MKRSAKLLLNSSMALGAEGWSMKTNAPALAPRVKVTAGSVVVSSVYVLHAGRVLSIVEVDCATKYPDVMCMSSDSVMLAASEHSLRRGRLRRETVVQFDLDGSEWGLEDAVAGSRYTVRLYFARRAAMTLSGGAAVLWRRRRRKEKGGR